MEQNKSPKVALKKLSSGLCQTLPNGKSKINISYRILNGHDFLMPILSTYVMVVLI